MPGEKDGGPFLAWWQKNEDGTHVLIDEAFDYVVEQTKGQSYDAIIGFSQGGVLATTLALSGRIPGVRAVVTAGAPMVKEAFEVVSHFATEETLREGSKIPKLHLAGETDDMVHLSSTALLCSEGGTGELVVHDKGHLFPTKSLYVKCILNFLATALED